MTYKIMHVVESLGGGVGHSIRTIIEGYCADIPAIVVHGKRDFVDGQLAFSEKVELIPWSAGREISPIADLKAVMQLILVVRRSRPTLIHAHSAKAGVLARIAALLTGVPCLYTPHSYSFLRSDVSKLAKGCYWAVEWILSGTAMTVACGLEEYSYASKLSNRCTIVENGVDVSIYRNDSRLKRQNGGFTVLAVGRITEQKNFPLFLEIARHPSMLAVSFVWITGEENPPSVPNTNVSVLGYIPPTDIAEALSNSQLFLNTSKWEGLSRAVLEAAAVGLPLLLSDAPGNRELNFRSKNASLFNTAEEAADRISRARVAFERGDSTDSDNVDVVKRFYDSRLTQSRFRSIYDAIAFSKMASPGP